MPEDRLLWLPSVSILLSAGIFPHCEARRGSEAPLLLLLLLLQTQGRASTMGGGEEEEGSGRGEGGRGQQRWGWGGLKKKKKRRGERGSAQMHIRSQTDSASTSFSRSLPGASDLPSCAHCLPFIHAASGALCVVFPRRSRHWLNHNSVAH